MKTKVKFYYEKLENEVFAYFPEEIFSFNGYRPDNYTCYSHIGQHSACHPDYVKECREANFDDYSDLKKELEGIGYKLEVLNADFKRQDAISKGKVWMIRWSDMNDGFFEGTKTACYKYVRENHFTRAYKKGFIRIGQVIYEPSPVS